VCINSGDDRATSNINLVGFDRYLQSSTVLELGIMVNVVTCKSRLALESEFEITSAWRAVVLGVGVVYASCVVYLMRGPLLLAES